MCYINSEESYQFVHLCVPMIVLFCQYILQYPWTHLVSILQKYTAGRYWPVRVADGPITARDRFIKNAGWALRIYIYICASSVSKAFKEIKHIFAITTKGDNICGLFFFVFFSVISYMAFGCPYLFLISPSFDASGRLCLVIVAFSGYFHLYVCSKRKEFQSTFIFKRSLDQPLKS